MGPEGKQAKEIYTLEMREPWILLPMLLHFKRTLDNMKKRPLGEQDRTDWLGNFPGKGKIHVQNPPGLRRG